MIFQRILTACLGAAFGFSASGLLLAAPAAADSPFTVRSLGEGLEHPWSIAAARDGALWVTERPGRLQRIDPATGQKTEIAGLPDIRARAEAGLMGLALDPDFAQPDSPGNGWLYLCYSTGSMLNPGSRRCIEEISRGPCGLVEDDYADPSIPVMGFAIGGAG